MTSGVRSLVLTRMPPGSRSAHAGSASFRHSPWTDLGRQDCRFRFPRYGMLCLLVGSQWWYFKPGRTIWVSYRHVDSRVILSNIIYNLPPRSRALTAAVGGRAYQAIGHSAHSGSGDVITLSRHYWMASQVYISQYLRILDRLRTYYSSRNASSSPCQSFTLRTRALENAIRSSTSHHHPPPRPDMGHLLSSYASVLKTQKVMVHKTNRRRPIYSSHTQSHRDGRCRLGCPRQH